jgi:hypothetical protein
MSNPINPEKVFRLTDFEPLKYRNQLFGYAVEFNHAKQHVKFISKFHDPDYLAYSQIAKLEVIYDPLRRWLWLGLILTFVIIGFVILIARAHLPPWSVKITLKNGEKISFRPRIELDTAQLLVNYCAVHFPAGLLGVKTN